MLAKVEVHWHFMSVRLIHIWVTIVRRLRAQIHFSHTSYSQLISALTQTLNSEVSTPKKQDLVIFMRALLITIIGQCWVKAWNATHQAGQETARIRMLPLFSLFPLISSTIAPPILFSYCIFIVLWKPTKQLAVSTRPIFAITPHQLNHTYLTH